MKIYMSGPMFTAADVAFNLNLAERLRSEGFAVYCPNESEPINDKTRTDVTADLIYRTDMAELEGANVVMMQVSEDSGTNWEAGYFDCLCRYVDPQRYYGIVGVASDIRLRTLPDPEQRGVHNMAGYVNPLIVGGLEQSLGVYQNVDQAIDRLREVKTEREAYGQVDEKPRTTPE